MKLKTALEISKECGLKNLSETLFNIRLHAMNLFLYGEEQKEYDEIINECRELKLNGDMLITDILKLL